MHATGKNVIACTAALCLLAAVSAGRPDGEPDAAWGRLPRKDCIETAEDFWKHFFLGDTVEVKCVSDKIFGRVSDTLLPDPDHPQYPEFGRRKWNFVSNYLGLQAYLEISSLYNDGTCRGAMKTLAGLQTSLGYAINTKIQGKSLFVFLSSCRVGTGTICASYRDF